MPATIGNRDDYLNIWVVNLKDPDPENEGVDDYGTFPNNETDSTSGVVVATFAFGYGEDEDGNDIKTIVVTHEIGHYLKLHHIWGDDECGDDMVADTPTALKANEGCPDFPHNVDSCTSDPNGEMFMNYMYYSDAASTVTFTNGQKERMRATLEIERSYLLSSQA